MNHKLRISITKNSSGMMILMLFCLVFTLVSRAQGSQAFELAPVMVVGEKIEDYIQKNPSQVVSMGAREIEERNFLQVNEALGSMAGVDVTPGSNGLSSRISIRGGGGSGSVLILVDGRPMGTQQYGGVDLGSIPIDIVKKITVFKPPVPVWLGPGSSAGAIYIETKSGRIPPEGKGQDPAPSKKAVQKTRIRLSGGSYGQANASATLKIDDQTEEYMLSGGYDHTDGKRDNSQGDQGHVNLHYGNSNGPFKYQVNAKAFASDHGVAGPTYNPTPNARQHYEKASLDFKAEGMLPKEFAFGSMEGGGMDYDITAFLDMKRLDDTANSGDTSKLDALTTGFGSNLFYSDTGEANELRFGTLLEHSQVDHTLSGDHNRDLASLNGVYTARLAPFILTAGLRSDYTSDFYFSPGGNGGLSYEINKTTLIKATAGYSENIPSFGQLYQPSHGSIDQVRGNPDLETEKILSVSLGVLHCFDNKTELDFSLFRTDTRNLIKYQRGDDLISRPENIDLAYKQGLESSLKFFISRAMDLDVNYIWQETQNRDNGKKLSYAPEHTLKLTLSTKFSTGTRMELTARGYTEQYTDTDNTETETIKAYITADAKMIHPLVLMDKKTEIFVHLHNLLDTDYESHYGYPDDGFKVQAGMNINF